MLLDVLIGIQIAATTVCVGMALFSVKCAHEIGNMLETLRLKEEYLCMKESPNCG